MATKAQSRPTTAPEADNPGVSPPEIDPVTGAMHDPVISADRRTNRIWIVLGVIVLAAVIIGFIYSGSQTEQANAPATESAPAAETSTTDSETTTTSEPNSETSEQQPAQ